jgi:hypothetical protein
MKATIICDDVVKWAENTAPIGAHALLADPPYELSFMNKRWDSSGIAFHPETWAALARHLLPGAFVMAFTSSRGWHRLACAIEDAGLILHPSIFNYRTGETIEVPGLYGFSYGSGFPKATRIDTQIDAAAGVERETVGRRVRLGDKTDYGMTRSEGLWKERGGLNDTGNVTLPTTPIAQAWAGHRYGRQCLKPAIEPLIVAQVPYSGRPVTSITETGAGALWIDGVRIGMSTDDHARLQAKAHQEANGDRTAPGTYDGRWRRQADPVPAKRWPPNLALCHLPACQPLGVKAVQGTNIPGPGLRPVGYSGCQGAVAGIQQYASPDGTETVQAYACAEGCPVAALDLQAGERPAGKIHDNGSRSKFGGPTYANDVTSVEMPSYAGGYGDTGPASRYFFTADWSLDVAEQLAQANPMRYCPKASASERHAGLEGRNTHCTVKPLSLCTWLASLLLPPAAYAPRRLLVPFCGTSSEMIGGILAGWEMVLGIERELTYVEMGRKRLAWWTGYTVPSPAASDMAQQETTVTPVSGQLNLFGRA